MAKLAQTRSQNVAGEFFVDQSCIDCDTCRWVAPTIFHRADDQSAVYHQPQTPAERIKALQALLACPTSSIGTIHKPKDIQKVQTTFPILIADNVYYCGYHSVSSFGGASYLIQREEGNILIDSPRFTPPLVKRLEAMGGIKYLYLTHKDDVADHQKFHDHFGCDRILHRDEITPQTESVEIKLEGHEDFDLLPDATIIAVPGHSLGHTVMLYQQKFLFTGDHLAWSAHYGHLIGFRRHCWYSWEELKKSMIKLTNYEFEWVLPGHGRRFHADKTTMAQALQDCIDWMVT
jgi:glyoxylase-like metal-dependent hydrolase (beta-lactamase superfamily II)/ferredoxin